MSNGRVQAIQQEEQDMVKVKQNLCLLFATYGALFVGSVSSSLLAKYYFVHGGSSRWVSTWVQSAGFPLLLILIYAPHFIFRTTTRRPFTRFTRRHLIFSGLIGFVLGFNNFLFSWGTSYLPVSTSSLLLSTQLIFTLFLSVIIVKQKVTFSNLNCVVLLTISSVLLALATLFATIGMAFDGGFIEMFKEANHVFTKGPTVYWTVAILGNVASWQLCFAATSAMVYLTSGLTSGICMTALLTLNVIGGVVVYGDEFSGVKIVSTVLCIWGFSSHVYGTYKKMKKEERKEKNGEYSGVKTTEEDAGDEGVEMGK
ncbi:hypothetical protein AALP_AAs43274U000100, partial [Arabis alpina]